jgi:phosphatidylethanolamine-binding protein (PEBP) family uncharacterized protein
VVHVPASPALRLATAGMATAALAAGCSSPGSPAAGASTSHAAPVTMKLTSSAFKDGGTIPKLYTCDGQGTSVPLSWSGAPKGTAWFAVTVIDPAGPVTHWYVIDIPAATTGIKQGASYSNSPPGKQLSSWIGMCPGGGPDSYQFTVYAMPSSYKAPKTYAGYAEDEDGLAANAIGIGQLTGYYAD